MKTHTARGHGRGFALILAMVVLAVASLLGGLMLQGLARHRQTLLLAERQAQAEWLVAAGQQRGRARLLEHDDYKGETWEIPTAELGGRGAARVMIAVTAEEGSPSRRRVAVRALFPLGELLQARRSRSFTVDVGRPPTGAQP